MMRLTLAALVLATSPAMAENPAFVFPSIDGGSYSTADWRGMPVLVVNTASQCGFTPQYDALQALSDRYAGRAVVLAVPSDDFAQELATEADVKDFCDANFNLTLPMTIISHVAKGDLHPFYDWVQKTQGIAPKWNFNKVLIGPDGSFAQSWGSAVKPDSEQITSAIDALIGG